MEHSVLLAPRKAHFLESLYAIARADGVVSNEEIEEIRLIATESGIRHPATTQ